MEAKQINKALSPKKKIASKSEQSMHSIGKSSKTSHGSTFGRVINTDLEKYCPKKFFYIFLVAESDDRSTSLLNNLVETSKNYEDVSSLTFITREDVLTLLNTNEERIFPNQLKTLLTDIAETIHEQGSEFISLDLESQLLKLKLIEVMYQQYAEHVKKNEKEKKMEAVLNLLSKECKKKQKTQEHEDKEKKHSPQRDDANKKPSKKEEKKREAEKDEEIDYTSIPINKDAISYEENIYDYVGFYCIKGFYDAEIMKHLFEEMDVPISGIIKVSESKNTQKQSGILKLFWEKISEFFFRNTSQYSSLENVVVLEFTPSNKSMSILEEFALMLRKIINIKLTYLEYLRHLTINQIKHSYRAVPLECMRQYNKSLRNMPVECINSELVLDSLLNEVNFINGSRDGQETESLKSIFLAKSNRSSIHCIDPLYDFDAFSSSYGTSRYSRNDTEINNYLVHDNDFFTKSLKAYKYIGPSIVDRSLAMVEQYVKAYCGFNNFEYVAEDIIHLHDKDPSTNLEIGNQASLDHFMYLFLFNKFIYCNTCAPNATSKYDLIKYLTTFDLNEFWKELQVQFEGETVALDENLYNLSVVRYKWKEILNKDLLLQEVYTASNEFLYADCKYSPETDNFLLVFSDKLDNFGINVKMYNVIVRSPICFRDFCRYTTVQEDEWVRESEIKLTESTFKIAFDENCPGAQKIKTQMKIFQEYSHLLNGDIIEEIDNDPTESTVDTGVQTEEGLDSEKTISFIKVIEDLEVCPVSSNNILSQCEKAIENERLLAYDFGTNLFKLTGKVTTFHSHDNVKVIVDNTRFLQDPEKCTINIITDENVLTLHSGEFLLKEPYIALLRLKDGSRISFVVRKNEPSDEPSNKISHELDDDQQEDVVEEPTPAEKSQEEFTADKKNSSVEVEPEPVVPEQVVHCVDEDYIKELLDGKSLDELSATQNREDLLESILNATENNGTIYKVNTKTNYLKRRNNNLKVPLGAALRNIISLDSIFYKEPKLYEIYTKRFNSGDYEGKSKKLESKIPVDFRVCLPNGLFVRAYSCPVEKEPLIIKQEYIQEKPLDASSLVQHEEFRLFTNQGFVVIKKIDGTITILKANGDLIDFEKPSDGSDDKIQTCHCSTFEDYRNKLNKILKDQENCDYSISRRAHITTKRNQILDSKILKLLEQFDVPYLKMSLTKFDGTRIKIQGDKITQKQLYHLISQQDFLSGAILSERNDGFRSIYDRSGCQKIFFPDGTIISNSVDIADELVDGFLYVIFIYQYEHPYYASVKYNFDKTSEIKLNNDTIIKENSDRSGFTISIQEKTVISVSDETMLMKKTCPECKGKYETYFNIKPFKDGVWHPKAEFMHVSDSYGKDFYTDFIGNCSRNSDYCQGPTNFMGCDHVMKTNYKKMFVIDRSLKGEALYTDNYVQHKINQMEAHPNSSIDYYNMIGNKYINIVDCREKFFEKFSDRFYNKSIENKLYHAKKSSQTEFYTSFRMFHEMLQLEEIGMHISNLQEIYFQDFSGDTRVCNNISVLTNALERCYKQYSQQGQQIIKRRRQSEDMEKSTKTQCICAAQRITMQEKMLRWRKACVKYQKKLRNKEFPVYFKSEFFVAEQ